jgi:Ser/Thr protein kinase RdoA (MazF antagonist)
MTRDAAERNSNVAFEILVKHWHIREHPLKTNLGVSRITWRAGHGYWLSQSDEARSAELIRQAALLQQLRCFLERNHLLFSVPEIVPAVGGELVVLDRGYGWSLTRHIEGYHPDSSKPEIYSALVEGLVRFHNALFLFRREGPIRMPAGISAQTRQSIRRLNLGAFVPFTDYSKEEEVLARAAEWLLPRLVHFEHLPRQLVHGDWTPQNVLFGSREHGVSVTAVLDFEQMRVDPVQVDVANVCSTLIMWSGLDRTEQRIREVLDTYERFSGYRLDPEHIYSAMLAHWFCHYWNWRDRIEQGGMGRNVKERLCLRIASALEFVSGTRL